MSLLLARECVLLGHTRHAALPVGDHVPGGQACGIRIRPALARKACGGSVDLLVVPSRATAAPTPVGTCIARIAQALRQQSASIRGLRIERALRSDPVFAREQALHLRVEQHPMVQPQVIHMEGGHRVGVTSALANEVLGQRPSMRRRVRAPCKVLNQEPVHEQGPECVRPYYPHYMSPHAVGRGHRGGRHPVCALSSATGGVDGGADVWASALEGQGHLLRASTV
eukprot:2828669-Rhodomonas_salina.2